MDHVITAVLGGGQGARLWPLTRDRAKPAVPLGGKFRLIDVAISNSLHAGIERIYILTQFHSASLHRHIAQTYRFDAFRSGFVDLLAAEQSIENRDWYQGTADAIRQNLSRMGDSRVRDVLILSGDHLYLMDLKRFVRAHRESNADLTIAVNPIARHEAPSFGIMQVDASGRIVQFVEKPSDDATLDSLTPTEATFQSMGFAPPEGSLLASMGIYVFKRNVLEQLLRQIEGVDFGKDVIPTAMRTHHVHAHAHQGYWRDIGTIPAFHEANLDLTRPLPPLNLYDPRRPIYTHPRFLPGTKVNHCAVHQSILCEGSIISASEIRDSLVGIRAIVRAGTTINRSILMGARYYESPARPTQSLRLGIGQECELRNCIVDLDATIGDGCRLVNEEGLEEADGDGWAIRGGIIVIPRAANIPDGTII